MNYDEILKELDAFIITPMSAIDTNNQLDINDFINTVRHNSRILNSNFEQYDMFPDIRLILSHIVRSIISPNGGLKETDKVYKVENEKLGQGTILALNKELENYVIEELDKLDFYKDIWDIHIDHGAVAKIHMNKGDVLNFLKQIKGNSSEMITLSKEPITTFAKNDYIDSVITLSKRNKEPSSNSETLKLFNSVIVDIEETYKLNIISDPTSVFLSMTESEERVTMLNKKSKRKDEIITKEIADRIEHLFNNVSGTYTDQYGRPIGVPVDDRYGKDVEFRVPAESVIPVISKGNPSDAKAYLVILGDDYSPLDRNSIEDSATGGLSDIVQRRFKDNNIIKTNVKSRILKEMPRIYSKMIKKQLTEEVQKIVGSGDTHIHLSDEILEVLFYRGLAAKRATVLFLTKEQMSYQAFNYRENGTGESLLEKVSLLLHFRAMVFLYNITASIKNSTQHKKITLNVPKDETDPIGWSKQVINNTMNQNNDVLSMGSRDINAIVKGIAYNGLTWVIKHPKIPDIDISVEDTASSLPINTELEEKLANMLISALDVNPELINNKSDFARGIEVGVHQNSKTNVDNQKKYIAANSNYVRLKIGCNTIIQKKLDEIVVKHKEEAFGVLPDILKVAHKKGDLTEEQVARYITINHVVPHIKLQLPELEKNNNAGLKETYLNFSESLDIFFGKFLNESAEIPKEITDKYNEKYGEMLYLIRLGAHLDFLENNSFLPNIFSNKFIEDSEGNIENSAMNMAQSFLDKLRESYKNKEGRELKDEARKIKEIVKKENDEKKLQEKIEAIKGKLTKSAKTGEKTGVDEVEEVSEDKGKDKKTITDEEL